MRSWLVTIVSMLAMAALCLSNWQSLSESERLATAVVLGLFIIGMLTRGAGRPDAVD